MTEKWGTETSEKKCPAGVPFFCHESFCRTAPFPAFFAPSRLRVRTSPGPGQGDGEPPKKPRISGGMEAIAC
jgi:hypothetical protein